MDILEFMDKHYVLAFFIIMGVCALFGAVINGVCNLIHLSWGRFLRHLNIRNRGWPPDHLDADGDFEEHESEKEKNDEL